MRSLAASLMFGLLLAVAGCGEDGGSTTAAETSAPSTAPSTAPTRSASRPDAVEIGKALIATQDGTAAGTYTPEEATCVGRILAESKLSDASLEMIVADLESFVPADAAEETIYRELIPLITTCVVNRVPTASPSTSS